MQFERVSTIHCGAPESLRGVFREHGIAVVAAQGERLMRENELGGGAYLVESGRVKLWLKGKGSRPAFTHTVRSGELFGLAPNFVHAPYGLNATAITASRVVFVDRDTLVDFMKEQPADAVWILACFSQDVHRLNQKVRRMVTR